MEWFATTVWPALRGLTTTRERFVLPRRVSLPLPRDDEAERRASGWARVSDTAGTEAGGSATAAPLLLLLLLLASRLRQSAFMDACRACRCSRSRRSSCKSALFSRVRALRLASSPSRLAADMAEESDGESEGELLSEAVRDSGAQGRAQVASSLTSEQIVSVEGCRWMFSLDDRRREDNGLGRPRIDRDNSMVCLSLNRTGWYRRFCSSRRNASVREQPPEERGRAGGNASLPTPSLRFGVGWVPRPSPPPPYCWPLQGSSHFISDFCTPPVTCSPSPWLLAPRRCTHRACLRRTTFESTHSGGLSPALARGPTSLRLLIGSNGFTN